MPIQMYENVYYLFKAIHESITKLSEGNLYKSLWMGTKYHDVYLSNGSNILSAGLNRVKLKQWTQVYIQELMFSFCKIIRE